MLPIEVAQPIASRQNVSAFGYGRCGQFLRLNTFPTHMTIDNRQLVLSASELA